MIQKTRTCSVTQKLHVFKYALQKSNIACLARIFLGVSLENTRVRMLSEEIYYKNKQHWRLASKATIYRTNLISCHNIPHFLLHFTPSPQLRKLRQTVYVIFFFFPPTPTKAARARTLETEVKTSPNTFQACLLFRCHCQALQSDRHVPQALLKCCHQVSLKIQPYTSSLFSPSKTRIFLQVFKWST